MFIAFARQRAREFSNRGETLSRGSGKFYKSRSQETNLSRGRNFSYFAAHVNEQDLF
jgi:hypothetical protein